MIVYRCRRATSKREAQRTPRQRKAAGMSLARQRVQLPQEITACVLRVSEGDLFLTAEVDMNSNDPFERIKTQNDALWTVLTSQDEQERRAAFEIAFGQKPEEQKKEQQ